MFSSKCESSARHCLSGSCTCPETQCMMHLTVCCPTSTSMFRLLASLVSPPLFNQASLHWTSTMRPLSPGCLCLIHVLGSPAADTPSPPVSLCLLCVHVDSLSSLCLSLQSYLDEWLAWASPHVCFWGLSSWWRNTPVSHPYSLVTPAVAWYIQSSLLLT